MKDAKKDEYVFLGLLLMPTIWFALLIAPYMDKGLINAILCLSEALDHPFSIQWTVGFYKNRKFMKENSQDAKVSFEEVYEEN